MLDPANRQLLIDTGKVVWLHAKPATLASRVAKSAGRPLLADAEDPVGVMRVKLQERAALYEATAGFHIQTDELSVAEVAGEIEALWKS